MDYISVVSDDIDLSSEHRYLRLPHPRTGQPQLYLPARSTTAASGSASRDVILEVVKVNCARRRTWFIGDSNIDTGTILIQHAVDPLFLVIPFIIHLLDSPSAGSYQPLDDLIATVSASSLFALAPPFTRATSGEKPAASTSISVNEDVSRLLSLRSVKKAFRLCCDRKVVPAAPPSPPADGPSASSSTTAPVGAKYYRPSMNRVIALLQRKVAHLSEPEQFEQFDHLVRGLARDGLLSSSTDQELVRAARTKASIETISQYLPPLVLAQLTKSYDLDNLTTHLQHRSAAALAASMPVVNASGKDKAGAAGAKRKAQPGSRGVESLKKVNTTGMAKMTSFFKKK